jgi:hypothetical protein
MKQKEITIQADKKKHCEQPGEYSMVLGKLGFLKPV